MADQFNTLSCPNGDFQVQKFGLVQEMDNGDPSRDLWPFPELINDGGIAPPAVFSSSSVNDTAAGTGMRRLRVEGVDTNGLFRTTDHDTNGTALVNLGGYAWINRAFGLSWGSSGFNEGTITFTDSTGGTPVNMASIPVSVSPPNIGLGQTLQAVFCIPKDWGQMIFLNWYASVGRQAATQANVVLAFNANRFFDSTGGIRVTNTFELNSQGTTFANNPIIPNCSPIPPLSMVRMIVNDVTANNSRISGGFGLGKAS